MSKYYFKSDGNPRSVRFNDTRKQKRSIKENFENFDPETEKGKTLNTHIRFDCASGKIESLKREPLASPTTPRKKKKKSKNNKAERLPAQTTPEKKQPKYDDEEDEPINVRLEKKVVKKKETKKSKKAVDPTFNITHTENILKKNNSSKFSFNNTVNLLSSENCLSKPVISEFKAVPLEPSWETQSVSSTSDSKNINHNVTLLQNVIIKKKSYKKQRRRRRKAKQAKKMRHEEKMRLLLLRMQPTQPSDIETTDSFETGVSKYPDVDAVMEDVKKIVFTLFKISSKHNALTILKNLTNIFDALKRLLTDSILKSHRIKLNEIDAIFKTKSMVSFEDFYSQTDITKKRKSTECLNETNPKKKRLQFQEKDDHGFNCVKEPDIILGNEKELAVDSEEIVNLCEDSNDGLVEKPIEIFDDVICLSSGEASEKDNDSLDEYHKSLDAYYTSTNQENITYEEFMLDYNKNKKKKKSRMKSIEVQCSEKDVVEQEENGIVEKNLRKQSFHEDNTKKKMQEDNVNAKVSKDIEEIEEGSKSSDVFLCDKTSSGNEEGNRIVNTEDPSKFLQVVLTENKIGDPQDQLEENKTEGNDLIPREINDSLEVSVLNSSELNNSGSSMLEQQINNWKSIIKSLISVENSGNSPPSSSKTRDIVNKKLNEILNYEELTEEQEDEIINEIVSDIFKTVAEDIRLVKKKKKDRNGEDENFTRRRNLKLLGCGRNLVHFKSSGEEDDSNSTFEQIARTESKSPNEDNCDSDVTNEKYPNSGTNKDVRNEEDPFNSNNAEDVQNKDCSNSENAEKAQNEELLLNSENNEDGIDMEIAEKNNLIEKGDELNLSKDIEEEDNCSNIEDGANLNGTYVVNEEEEFDQGNEENEELNGNNVVNEGEEFGQGSEEENDELNENDVNEEEYGQGNKENNELPEEKTNINEGEIEQNVGNRFEDDFKEECKTEAELLDSLTHEIHIKQENYRFEDHNDEDLIEVLEGVDVVYVEDSEDEEFKNQASDEVDIFQDETLYDIVLTNENTDLTLNTDVEDEKLPQEYVEAISAMEIVLPMEIAIWVHKKYKCPDCKCKEFSQKFEKIDKTEECLVDGKKVKPIKYSAAEDEMILANFKDFCQTHNLPLDHRPFTQSSYYPNGKKKRILSYQNRQKLLLYLSYGLENRNLEGVFSRFKKIFTHSKDTKKFTEEENKYIMERMEELRGNRQALKIIAGKMKRAEIHVRRHYAYLKMCKKFNRDNKGRRKRFGVDEKVKLIRALLEETGLGVVDELKDYSISNTIWRNIAETMHFSPLYVKAHWLGTLHPQFFVTGTRNIGEIINKFCDLMIEDQLNDYKDINYDKYVKHFDGMTKIALQTYFKREVTAANLLPKFKLNFKGLLLDLKKYYEENDSPANVIKYFDWEEK